MDLISERFSALLRGEISSLETYDYISLMKKALGETQTLRAGRSNATPKIFSPAPDPLPGGAGPPKFNQLEMVSACTD